MWRSGQGHGAVGAQVCLERKGLNLGDDFISSESAHRPWRTFCFRWGLGQHTARSGQALLSAVLWALLGRQEPRTVLAPGPLR